MTSRPAGLACTAGWSCFLLSLLLCLAGPPQNGILALWPSLVAIVLAFVTANIHLALFTGALGGALLLQGGDLVASVQSLLLDHLLPALSDNWNLSVLAFTLMMGGLVELLNRNGGMAGVAHLFLGRRTSRRRVTMTTYFLGWVVFLDGLANAMLVGGALRGLAERARVSRAKLAFIVDGTSSPIAGLALISTWVAYEMSVLREGLQLAGHGAAAEGGLPYLLLIQSLPWRGYNWLLLALVAWVAWRGRDWEPMGRSERAALSRKTENASTTREEEPGSALLVFVPVALLVLGVFAGLYIDGGGLGQPWGTASLIEAFGRAHAAQVFLIVTTWTLLVTLILSSWMPSSRLRRGSITALFEGMSQMFQPALILMFAWVLGSVVKGLGGASYLTGLIEQGGVPVALLPGAVFLISAVVSFATGTSWGTMALVMPLAIPVVVQATGWDPSTPAPGVVVGVVGAVLSGAVFGDHCSPVSDTTVVSAVSCGCDVMEHVRTQMPYALAAALLSLLTLALTAFTGMPAWLGLAIGGGVLWIWLETTTRPPLI